MFAHVEVEPRHGFLGDTLDIPPRWNLTGRGRRDETYGERGPSVLVLEDVHAADEATLDVLWVLARRVDGLPALAATARGARVGAART